ncbi:MAG: hypothetical protein QG604_637 [Candidatus Dependentiae bacterium]|nr:hypothetical protein [Candidatus Dependentiae bacterium]
MIKKLLWLAIAVSCFSLAAADVVADDGLAPYPPYLAEALYKRFLPEYGALRDWLIEKKESDLAAFLFGGVNFTECHEWVIGDRDWLENADVCAQHLAALRRFALRGPSFVVVATPFSAPLSAPFSSSDYQMFDRMVALNRALEGMLSTLLIHLRYMLRPVSNGAADDDDDDDRSSDGTPLENLDALLETIVEDSDEDSDG